MDRAWDTVAVHIQTGFAARTISDAALKAPSAALVHALNHLPLQPRVAALGPQRLPALVLAYAVLILSLLIMA